MKFIFYPWNATPQNQITKANKQAYTHLCSPIAKYQKELDTREAKAEVELQKRMGLYEDYANGNHLNIGEHFHIFDSIDLGEGFYAHVGMYWPQGSPIIDISTAIVMECEMNDEHGPLTLTQIYNEDGQRMESAFFTRLFQESWSDTTQYGMDMLCLTCAQSDYSIIGTVFPSCEARWIFPEGMAFGRKQCGFYVFDDFTDSYKHPMRALTDSDWDSIWNDYRIV